MFCQVNLLTPLASSNIESIFLEALALEGALRPKAPAATFSQGEAEGEDTRTPCIARALPPTPPHCSSQHCLQGPRRVHLWGA